MTDHDYTMAEAAAEMGLSMARVRALAVDGELPGAYQRAGRWFVPRAAVDVWRANWNKSASRWSKGLRYRKRRAVAAVESDG